MATIKHFRDVSQLTPVDKIAINKLMRESVFILNDEAVEDFINRKGGSVVTIEEDGKYVAFACLSSILEHRTQTLQLLYVDSDYREKGYASNILQYINKFAKQEHFTKTYLAVILDNTPARRLYEKFGFIYDNTQNSRDVSSMVRYTSKTTNFVAKASFEMFKKFGSTYYQMILPTLVSRNYDMFGKHFEKEPNPIEVIDAVLSSEEMLNTATLIREIILNRDRMDIVTTIKYKINNDETIDEDIVRDYSNTFKLPLEEIRKCCDIVECMNSLHLQDRFLEYEAQNKDYHYVTLDIVEEAGNDSNVIANGNYVVTFDDDIMDD